MPIRRVPGRLYQGRPDAPDHPRRNPDYPVRVILVVDTSLGTAVAVVDEDGTLVAESSSSDPLRHAEVIGDLLRQSVADREITQVVSGMGPGPFTGLRIGIAAARTFALGRNLPVLPVPSHLAPALVSVEEGTTGAFAIVTDVRRREFAVTVFDGLDDDGIPLVIADTVLVPRAEVEGHLAGTPVREASAIDAAALGRVAARAHAAARVLTGHEPLYLRQPDISLPGPPKRVTL